MFCILYMFIYFYLEHSSLPNAAVNIPLGNEKGNLLSSVFKWLEHKQGLHFRGVSVGLLHCFSSLHINKSHCTLYYLHIRRSHKNRKTRSSC